MQVRIVDGCIVCGTCEALCPEVFTVLDTAYADNSAVPGFEAECREAARACPVSVIKVQE